MLKKLGGGDRRSVGKVDEVVSEVLVDARLFGPLFDAMTHDDPLVRMRAADAVEKITAMRSDFLVRFKTKLLTTVARVEQQEVRWHVAQLFSRVEWSKAERRRAADVLKSFLSDKSKIVKTFSMQALADLAMKEKSLRPTTIKLIQELTESGSPAMQSRGRKLLAMLETV
jgi:hypothetical protein